jgi:hypothetical protein
MAIDFPSSPVNDQIYTDPGTGAQYIYVSAYTYWKFLSSNSLDAVLDGQIVFDDNNAANGSNGIIFSKSSNTIYANTISLSNTLTVISGATVATINVVPAIASAYNAANAAPGIANSYADSAAAGANAYMISVQNGSNTAIGAGANSYATSAAAGANAYMISVQNGSNTAVGAGANAYAATVGVGANSYATSAAAGANAYMISVQNGSNTAIGAGANAYADTKLANTSGVSFNGNLYFPSGNVGIGNTNSNHLLTIGDDGNWNAFRVVREFSDGSEGVTINTWDNAGSAGSEISLYANGSIVTPSFNEKYYAAIGITGTVSNPHMYIGTYGGASSNGRADVQFAANGTTRMIIKANGNIGIANTNPPSPLTVGGVIESTTGGIKYPDGTIQTTAAVFSAVGDQTSSGSTFYPLITTTTSGTLSTANVSTTKMSFVPSTGTLSATVFSATSDITQKTNIENIYNALGKVECMRGVGFNWKDTGKKSYGVIAQELETILPELVDESDNIKSVNYLGIIAFLIQAIKELNEKIESK